MRGTGLRHPRPLGRRGSSGGAARARDRGRGALRRRQPRPLQHRRLDLPDRAAGRGRCRARSPTSRRRSRSRARRASPSLRARRRHLAGRPDRRPRPRDRQQQVSRPARRARPGRAHGLGRARHRARRPQPPAARPHGLWFPGRHLDQQPRDDRRHGRQQQLRLALAALRHHGRQRAGDRGHPRRWRAGHVRPGAGQPARRSAAARTTSRSSRSCARSPRARPTRSASASPKLLRRVGGYNLDSIDPAGHNMAHLLVGSEGTLAYFTADQARRCSRCPTHKVLGVCHFPSFRQAMDIGRSTS